MTDAPTSDEPGVEPGAICGQCGASLIPLSHIHVQRECDACHRMTYVAESGDANQGLRIRKGDVVTIPAGAIRFSLDPSKSTGRLTRDGVSWLFQHLLFNAMPGNATGWTSDALNTFLETTSNEADNVLRTSPLFADLDLESESGGEQALQRIEDRHDLSEFWATMTGSMTQIVQQYIEEQDPLRATWAASVLMNARTMLIFKQHLEEIVWRGYRIGGLQDVLGLWHSNQSNGNEEFWQATLSKFSYVLSQIFSYPVVILQGKAYVGGKSIRDSEGNLVDFLIQNALSENTALIEIKTPKTKLLGRSYRGVHPPSSELSGAVLQGTNYKFSLMRHHPGLQAEDERRFDAFDPPCIVIAGSLTEVSDPKRRKSFELFRQGLKSVQVITYDELFGKVEALIKLLQ